jgi:Metalloenzyme superfamily
MKNSVLLCYLLISTSFIHPSVKMAEIATNTSASENLFIIITDGFRWQEVFNGADSLLINNETFTADTATLKSMYWANTKEERRKRLMPFFWNVIANKGQLIGNRDLKNNMNVANIYAVSYPGYNEIFTGTTDISISGNGKKNNSNINVLEYLESKDEFKSRIAVFSSWDVFPYILNRKRNNLMMNSGYEQMKNKNEETAMINAVQERAIINKTATRYDMLTYTTAKEYIKTNKPRVVVIGFGETDDFGHQKRYDLYLQQANQVDRMIGELWHMVQTIPGYKNNTSFLITTDHGRGNNTKHWSSHGFFIDGSSQTWLAMIGPNIKPISENAEKLQVYNRQLAKTIANLVGEKFSQKTLDR